MMTYVEIGIAIFLITLVITTITFKCVDLLDKEGYFNDSDEH